MLQKVHFNRSEADISLYDTNLVSFEKNVKQPSPLFSQERAPTSVPYAENQSMFLDSLVSDAAWRAIYARDADNNPIPFELLEEEIRSSHPFDVLQLRGMLSVSYFEKALYELPPEEVTAAKITELADQMELDIQGGYSLRPILAVSNSFPVRLSSCN